MQVSIETTSGLERRMTITVPSDTFESQITERLKDATNRVRLDGFRPGKVPMKEVRRRFGKAVRQEIASELMQNSFFEAVQQEDLSPAGSPNLEIMNIDPGQDFEFAATFEVFPHVEVGELAQVAVTRPTAEIEDADVERVIDNLLEQRKTYEPVERGADVADRVTIDFVGRIDEEVFEGGSGEDVAFEIGAGQMIEDFDAAVRGEVAGAQCTFDATFPDDYRAEDLQGKTAQFEVTVKEVAEPSLPELDEELFKAFGVEEGGEAAFRDEVRSNMQREMDAAVRGVEKRQVLDELARLHEMQLPQAMIEREIVTLKQQMQQQMSMYAQGQKLPDMPDEMFTGEAERRVKVGLVINEIVSAAELEADPEKVRERIETLAQSYAQPEQVVNWYYSNEQQLSQIQMAVLEDEVVEHVLGQALLTELPSSYQDIISGKALPDDEDAEADTEEGGEAQDRED